jgi:hypothetical protein
MKQTETKIFFSPNVCLSAALVLLLNSQPEFNIVNGKVLFGLPITDAHYLAMAEYNSGSAINALEFTMSENLPSMDPTTRSGLINYKEALLNLDCTIIASRVVDCIDFIVETGKEVRRG